MSALGSLVVQLTLENAQFINGMDKSGQAAQRHAQAVGKSFDSAEASAKEYFGRIATGAVAAVGAYASIRAVIDGLSNSINTLAKLDDQAQKTGSSVENLSKIQKTVAAFGGSFDAVDTAIAKLAKGMGTVDSDTNKANNALKALGISSRDTAGNLRDPSQVMIEIAKNLQNYADGAGKTALATDLFGKSGAELLPILNDLADNVDRFSGVSTEAAQQASLLQDQMGELNGHVDSLYTGMALSLMPALTDIAGAMNSTSTNTVAFTATADAAGVALKILVIGGGLVGLAFTQMGTAIGAAAAMAERFAHLDFSGVNTVKNLFLDDIKGNAYSFAKFAGNVWNGSPEVAQQRDKINTPAAAKPALNYQSGAAAASAASAKSATSEYDKLIGSIREKTAAQSLELTGQAKLTAGQKIANDAMTQLRDGTLKLTSAQKMKLTGELENLLATEQSVIAMQSAKKATDDLSASAKKATDDLFESGRKQVDSVQQQLDAQREQNALVGLSEEQIVALTGAKDLELAANLRNAAVYAGDMHDAYMIYASDLERAAALQKELVSEKAIAARFADLDRIGASVERTLEQSLVMFAANGAKAGKAILESFKMTFIKGVYEFAARPIALKFIASITGSMATGAANAAGGGAIDTLFSAAGLMNAGKMLWSGFSGGIASGMSMFTSGIGSLIGSTALTSLGAGMATTATGAAAMSGAAGLWGAGAGVGGLAGMGASMAAMAGPLAAVAAALFAMKGLNGDKALFGLKGWAGTLALGLLPAMFGLGPKKIIGQGIEGDFGVDGFQGKSYVDTLRKGGWFRGNRQEHETTDFDSVATARMDTAMALLRSSTAEYANVLSLPVDAIAGYTKHIRVAFTGDAAGDKKAIDDMFLDIADSLAGLTGNFDKFIQEGETAAITLKRLATEFVAVDAALKTMNLQVGAVGLESMEARERLISLAGGIDALNSAASFYQANFLNEGQRFVQQSVLVIDVMQSLGLAAVKNKAQFAALVQGLADSGQLATEAGARMFAALMQIAPVFAAVADQITKVREDNLAAATAAADTARAALSEAYQRESSDLRTVMATHRDYSRSLLEYKDLLLMGALSTLSGGQKYAAAGTQLDKTYDLFRSGAANADQLKGAAQAFLESSREQNASSAAFAVDFDKVQNILDRSATSAMTQASIAQSQLSALDASVSGLININSSVLSVRDAIFATRSAQATQAAASSALAGATTAQIGTSADKQFVDSLYTSLLGRAPDAAGEMGWLSQLASGASTASIIAGFTGSQEYLQRVPGHANGGIASGWSMVGERGPELVNFTNPGRVYTAGETRSMMGGDSDNAALAAAIQALKTELLVELRAANLQRGAVATATVSKLEAVAEKLDANKRELARAT